MSKVENIPSGLQTPGTWGLFGSRDKSLEPPNECLLAMQSAGLWKSKQLLNGKKNPAVREQHEAQQFLEL